MTVYLSPIANEQVVDTEGAPLVGGYWEVYLAGTTTPVTTYTSNTGLTAQPAQIVLDASGRTANPIWLTGGVAVKFRLSSAAAVVLLTIDNVSGVNDPAGITSQDQWVVYAATPTYISATSFSVAGDQTGTFQVGRRVRTTNSGGTRYSSITASVFGAVTTVTVVNDSGTLDAGLSAVSYGLLSATNPSVPTTYAKSGANTDITSVGAVTGVTATAGDNTTKLATTAFVQTAVTLRSYLAGLTMSTAGASATMSIAAGQCADSTNAVQMSLTAIAKTTSAWAVGTAAGGLDTGAIANSTWYHFYVIRRPDTGVVDVTFSTNATTPTLPTNYTQYRRIGSGRTNGSAQWTLFVQTGDYFEWDVSLLDVSAANPGTAAVTRTLTVPTGVVVEAVFNGGYSNTASGVAGGALFSALSKSDQAASEGGNPLWSTGAYSQIAAGGARTSNVPQRIFTNTSAQIRSRLSASDANVTLLIATLGWIDSRGKLA